MRAITVHLPDDELAYVDEMAARETRTRSLQIRTFIREPMLRHVPHRSIRLSLVLETFVGEIKAELGQESAAAFEAAFRGIDLQADGIPDADAFLRAAEWIVSHGSKSVAERIEMIDRLRQLKGRRRINLREFTGWS